MVCGGAGFGGFGYEAEVSFHRVLISLSVVGLVQAGWWWVVTTGNGPMYSLVAVQFGWDGAGLKLMA